MTCQNLAPIWLPNWGEMHAHARVWAAGEEGQNDSLATTVARAGVGDAGGQAAKETWLTGMRLAEYRDWRVRLAGWEWDEAGGVGWGRVRLVRWDGAGGMG